MGCFGGGFVDVIGGGVLMFMKNFEVIVVVDNVVDYEYGWLLDIEIDFVFKGLIEDMVWFIFVKKNEL